MCVINFPFFSLNTANWLFLNCTSQTETLNDRRWSLKKLIIQKPVQTHIENCENVWKSEAQNKMNAFPIFYVNTNRQLCVEWWNVGIWSCGWRNKQKTGVSEKPHKLCSQASVSLCVHKHINFPQNCLWAAQVRFLLLRKVLRWIFMAC